MSQIVTYAALCSAEINTGIHFDTSEWMPVLQHFLALKQIKRAQNIKNTNVERNTMNNLLIIFCFPLIVFSTYVKEGARISINEKSRQSFASLKDSTFVGQSIIEDRVWIELYGFVKMEDLKKGKIDWISKFVKTDNSGKLWPAR
jgi:hypothetical protein